MYVKIGIRKVAWNEGCLVRGEGERERKGKMEVNGLHIKGSANQAQPNRTPPKRG